MTTFYSYPQNVFIGKVTKTYAEIENDDRDVIKFNVSVSAFVPSVASDKFETIEEYKKHIVSSFFSDEIVYNHLHSAMPDGYYIEPHNCFDMNVVTGIDSIREFDKIYNTIKFSISVKISEKIHADTIMYPVKHTKAISDIFTSIDFFVDSIQKQSKFMLLFTSFNAGKVRVVNRINYLNQLAQNYKYLIHEQHDA